MDTDDELREVECFDIILDLIEQSGCDLPLKVTVDVFHNCYWILQLLKQRIGFYGGNIITTQLYHEYKCMY